MRSRSRHYGNEVRMMPVIPMRHLKPRMEYRPVKLISMSLIKIFTYATLPLNFTHLLALLLVPNAAPNRPIAKR